MKKKQNINLDFHVDQQGRLKKYTGPGGDMILPDFITEICSHAFSSQENLTSLYISDSVKIINNYSFFNCKDLVCVTIQGDIKFLGDDAFFNCINLNYFITPRISIRDLKRELKIPAVRGFSKLYCENIKLDETIRADYLKYIRGQRKRLYQIAVDCSELMTVLIQEKIIPESDMKLVLEMASQKQNAELTAMLLEYQRQNFKPRDPMKEMEAEFQRQERFLETGILSPSDAKKIWRYKKLESGGIKILGYKGTDSIVIIPAVIGKEPVKILGNYALSPLGKPLTREVRKARASIVSVLISANIQEIGTALDGCPALEMIQIDAQNQNYFAEDGVLYTQNNQTGEKILTLCPMAKRGNLTLSDGLKEIPDKAFSDCLNLENIRLPDSIDFIGKKAFANCTNLTHVKLPAGIQKIARDAFAGVGEIQIELSPESQKFQIENKFLIENRKKRKLLCCLPNPTGIYQVPDRVESIPADLFTGLSNLKEVQMPESVIRIAKKAFLNCETLERVILPTGLEKIPSQAFKGCVNLHEINFSQLVNLNRIASCAFERCERLETADFSGSKLAVIENTAFLYCSALNQVKFSKDLQFIGYGAFLNCSALESILFPVGFPEAETSAFGNCRALKRVMIQSETDIKNYLNFKSIFICSEQVTFHVPANIAKDLKDFGIPVWSRRSKK